MGTSIGDEDFFLNPEIKYASDKSYKRKVERNFVPFEELFKRKLPVTALSFAVAKGAESLFASPGVISDSQ